MHSLITTRNLLKGKKTNPRFSTKHTWFESFLIITCVGLEKEIKKKKKKTLVRYPFWE